MQVQNIQERSVDVVIFKSANSKTNNGDKVYFSEKPNPLTEKGQAQALKLQDVIKSKGPFAQVISGTNQAALETAFLACGGTVGELPHFLTQASESLAQQKGERGVVDLKGAEIQIRRSWRQVDLKYFEGKDASYIQQKFREAFRLPADAEVPEANDCMNYEWPPLEDGTICGFEAYKTQFNPRIRQNLTEIFNKFATDSSNNVQVAVFAQKEPNRSAMLESEASEELKKTKFWQDAQDNGKSLEGAKRLEDRLIRYNLNNLDGSWIKIRVFWNRIVLLDVCEGKDFEGQETVYRQ